MGLLSFAAESNYSIKKIEVVNNREIPYEIILDVMVSKEGNKFVTENMIADYQKIKELDYVGNVSIYPQYYNEGIKLVVDIREKRDTKVLLKKMELFQCLKETK